MAGTTRLELATSAVTAAWIGFTTTYHNAGTAKLPVSRTRLHELWVGLWVGKSGRWPRARRTGNPLPNGLVSSARRQSICYILNHMVQYNETRLDASFAA